MDALDALAATYGNRSQAVEAAVRALLVQRAARERDARDLGILNRVSDRLNAEALDVLEYQAE